MGIIISPIPVVQLKPTQVNKAKQWRRSPITQMKELMNKSLKLSRAKLQFKEFKSCQSQAWEKLTNRSRAGGVVLKMLVVKEAPEGHREESR